MLVQHRLYLLSAHKLLVCMDKLLTRLPCRSVAWLLSGLHRCCVVFFWTSECLLVHKVERIAAATIDRTFASKSVHMPTFDVTLCRDMKSRFSCWLPSLTTQPSRLFLLRVPHRRLSFRAICRRSWMSKNHSTTFGLATVFQVWQDSSSVPSLRSWIEMFLGGVPLHPYRKSRWVSSKHLARLNPKRTAFRGSPSLPTILKYFWRAFFLVRVARDKYLLF